MTTIKFKNLIDVNTGKTVEIEVPDDYVVDELPGKRAREFAERINKVTNHLREVESLDEVGKLGSEAGRKLHELFKNYGFGKRG